jgi:regulatory protein
VSPRRSTPVRTALADATRLLARRPLTEFELRERLGAAGHAGADVEEACERMRAAGYVDDGRLAADFIAARAERLGHGPLRLVEDLCRRGVAREVAERALRGAVDRGDIDPRALLRRRLRRHLPGTKPSRRDLARVYNALRRAGFDDDAIRTELDALDLSALHGAPSTYGASDDVD